MPNTRDLRAAFTDFQLHKPDVLIYPAQEQGWQRYVEGVRYTDALIEIMRDLLDRARELWKQDVQYGSIEKALGRTQLYSAIQAASMTAQVLAKKWGYEQSDPAEGNDIAMIEKVIKHLMKRRGTTHKKEWQATSDDFSSMFDEQNEQSLMWFVKEGRIRKREGWEKLEDWLSVGRGEGEQPVRQIDEFSQPDIEFDQRRPGTEDLDPP
jgi:hypothetical protein